MKPTICIYCDEVFDPREDVLKIQLFDDGYHTRCPGCQRFVKIENWSALYKCPEYMESIGCTVDSAATPKFRKRVEPQKSWTEKHDLLSLPVVWILFGIFSGTAIVCASALFGGFGDDSPGVFVLSGVIALVSYHIMGRLLP